MFTCVISNVDAVRRGFVAIIAPIFFNSLCHNSSQCIWVQRSFSHTHERMEKKTSTELASVVWLMWYELCGGDWCSIHIIPKYLFGVSFVFILWFARATPIQTVCMHRLLFAPRTDIYILLIINTKSDMVICHSWMYFSFHAVRKHCMDHRDRDNDDAALFLIWWLTRWMRMYWL